MVLVEEPAVAEQDDRDGPQGRSRGDQEHDHDLILDRLDRAGPGQELAGHHPGQTDDADDHHRVDGRDQAGPHGLLDRPVRGLPPRGPERQQGLDLVALPG